MKKQKMQKQRGIKCHKDMCSGLSCIYGLGFIGALVYYLQASTGFWASILAILKAFVWPALLIYKLLGL